MQVSTPPRPAVTLAADVPDGRSRSRRDRRPLLLVAVASVAITLHEARFPFDSDAWWHMSSGDLILDGGTLPREDPFAWTAAGRPWPINSWLYDVLSATLRAAGGSRLVSALLFAAAGASPSPPISLLEGPALDPGRARPRPRLPNG